MSAVPVDPIVVRGSEARLPTRHGDFRCIPFTSPDGRDHLAVVCGDIDRKENVLARLHSECLTGDVFGSARCDCGEQLDSALQRIAVEGVGVVVYLRGHEGRGIGLVRKITAYELQDQGFDTVEANISLDLPVDDRQYDVGAQILRSLGVRSVRLMTNNPGKIKALEVLGIRVSDRVAVSLPTNPHNIAYIQAKRDKLGHLFGDLEASDPD